MEQQQPTQKPYQPTGCRTASGSAAEGAVRHDADCARYIAAIGANGVAPCLPLRLLADSVTTAARGSLARKIGRTIGCLHR